MLMGYAGDASCTQACSQGIFWLPGNPPMQELWVGHINDYALRYASTTILRTAGNLRSMMRHYALRAPCRQSLRRMLSIMGGMFAQWACAYVGVHRHSHRENPPLKSWLRTWYRRASVSWNALFWSVKTSYLMGREVSQEEVPFSWTRSMDHLRECSIFGLCNHHAIILTIYAFQLCPNWHTEL